MATYIAKEIKCATAYKGDSALTNYASINKKCCVGRIDSSSNVYRSFFDYDLSGLPTDVEINSASLYVYTSSASLANSSTSSTRLPNVYKCENTWSEDSVSLGNQPSISQESYGHLNTVSVGWKQIDITDLVKELITDNYGICLKLPSELSNSTCCEFANRYGDDTTLASYIEINYVGNQLYKISESRVREIADEVRRLTNTTEPLTINEMIAVLRTLPSQTVE